MILGRWNLRTTKADWVLFLSLVILSLLWLVFMRYVLPGDKNVQIDVDGKPVYLFPIDTDRVIKVEGPLGISIVEIKDRRVRMLQSPCSTQWCVRQGWHSEGTVICLPNRVIVTFGSHGDLPGSGLDAITG